MSGPLSGLRVIEFGGIGPGPFCAMLLADLGADLIRIDRLQDSGLGFGRNTARDVTRRGRPTIGIDMKSADGRAAALRLLSQADAMIEGFRPGVMERLDLGPDACLAANPKLVYVRMTGWGQDGTMAMQAGHDINYLAQSGILSMLGRAEGKPAIPLNMIADLGGGALFAAFGMLAALRSASVTGRGQIVDVAMVDGLASLLAPYYGFLADGRWREEREANFLDGGAPWYDVYETADGGYMAVGAIEPKFYANLLRVLELDSGLATTQMKRETWPALRGTLAECFAKRSRAEWEVLFADAEACTSPVLGLAEAADRSRQSDRPTVMACDGLPHPLPAPRFSATPTALPTPASAMGTDTDRALSAWGWTTADITTARQAGTLL